MLLVSGSSVLCLYFLFIIDDVLLSFLLFCFFCSSNRDTYVDLRPLWLILEDPLNVAPCFFVGEFSVKVIDVSLMPLCFGLCPKAIIFPGFYYKWAIIVGAAVVANELLAGKGTKGV
jgi:hypothetical protein